MNKTLLALVLLSATLLAGCDFPEDSTQIEKKQQEQLSLQSVQAVGMPAVVNFAEKRMMKDIIEIRDNSVPTITYIADMNGKMHKLCDSVGFGLPYSTQYTNPQKIESHHQVPVVLPQADPNGLFSPSSSDGTWVQCVNPKTNKEAVVYVEPRIVVSPFELQ